MFPSVTKDAVEAHPAPLKLHGAARYIHTTRPTNGYTRGAQVSAHHTCTHRVRKDRPRRIAYPIHVQDTGTIHTRQGTQRMVQLIHAPCLTFTGLTGQWGHTAYTLHRSTRARTHITRNTAVLY